MAETAKRNSAQRLVYVNAGDFDVWKCRPPDAIEILDLHDRPVGRFDGLVIERDSKRPTYIVVGRSANGDANGLGWFLAPVGDVWFDETARVVRIDALKRKWIPFDPDEFERMSPEDADAYERRVLATCCPEVGFHRNGQPDYGRQLFTCPPWLQPSGVPTR